MKRIVLTSLFTFALTACGGSSEETGSDSSGQTQNETNDEVADDSPGAQDGPGAMDGDSESPDNEPSDNEAEPSDPGDEPVPVDIDVPPASPATPSGIAPESPPATPTTQPKPVSECEDKQCGEPCYSGLSLLIAGPSPGPMPASYCNQDGACVTEVPSCDPPETGECTEECAVPLICDFCDDGETCAKPHVACNPDGSCGEVTWSCPEDDPSTCPESCPVTDACQPCDDGSCASAKPTCNSDGSCGPTEYTCPDFEGDECSTDADCPATRIACRECGDGFASCPSMGCVDGECVLRIPECGDDYDPCASKEDGDPCTACPPNDPACSETAELKACQDGMCRAAQIISESE